VLLMKRSVADAKQDLPDIAERLAEHQLAGEQEIEHRGVCLIPPR
jgi:hypothetical protein